MKAVYALYPKPQSAQQAVDALRSAAGQRRIGVKHVDRSIEPFALACNCRRKAKRLRRIRLLLDHRQRHHRPVEQHRDRRASLHILRATRGDHLADL